MRISRNDSASSILRQQVRKSRHVRLFLYEARVVRALRLVDFLCLRKLDYCAIDGAPKCGFSQSAIFAVGF